MTFADEVAKLCYSHFKLLPKKGKPQIHQEWTLLAAMLMSTDPLKKSLTIVSLCTGTKCLGYTQLSEKGDIISDSHAEVLVRRGLVKFLLHQMYLIVNNQDSSVLDFNEMKFSLKSGVRFHLFISQVPCGDAAIFPKMVEEVVEEREPKRLKRDEHFVDVSTTVSNNDIYRTGAKCVDDGIQDPKEPGVNFHVLGALRTKPGRGDPTWSMSCSDKIALWNVCGLQGALLSNLLKSPIYLSSIIFGKCPFNEKAVQRAVVDRLSCVSNLPIHYHLNKPAIYLSSLTFEHSKEKMLKDDPKAAPCSSAVIWCDVPDSLEVSVNGKKQGVTKKNINKPSSRISLCRSALLEKFLEVISLIPANKTNLNFSGRLTYWDYKLLAKSYQEAKNSVLTVFEGWKRKPIHLQKFSLSVK